MQKGWKNMPADTEQSIEQLEDSFWGEPEFDSYAVTSCHKLRQIPIGELTVENLRLLVGQKMGLPHIMPLALERLAENPFCGGNMYDGDLLLNVLKIDASFWVEHMDLFRKLFSVMEEVEEITNLALPLWDKIKHNAKNG